MALKYVKKNYGTNYISIQKKQKNFFTGNIIGPFDDSEEFFFFFFNYIKNAKFAVRDRIYSENCLKEKNKIKNQIKAAYQKAPYYKLVMPIIERILDNEEKNLFLYLYNSIILVKEYLNINTQLIISSSINMNHNLKSQDRVIEICRQLKADHYINPIGGTNLYDKKEFEKYGIKLSFLKTDDIIYKQFDNEFIPNLSIIDVMMFNSKDEINKMLDKFTLI